MIYSYILVVKQIEKTEMYRTTEYYLWTEEPVHQRHANALTRTETEQIDDLSSIAGKIQPAGIVSTSCK
ncbi:MAG: hypothetical protein B1H09_00370 [Gemmatimonadaceae bacterium 4484_173]|nr:MAG: hypothetical protein B1H09_00370 [Gemmatimonadaceae bacterium 4484_173]